ncbi:MAG: divergent polysaccharide deacetylase family protein, partial [Pseudomonadota bacterium]
MSWKTRNRNQQTGGSWTGGFFKGLLSGSLLTTLAVLGVVYLLPPPETLIEATEEDAAEAGGAAVPEGLDTEGPETAALREERGRSGPTTEGNFAEEALPGAPVTAPSRAPSVAVPGGGSAPTVAPTRPGGDTDTSLAGLDSSALVGGDSGGSGLAGGIPQAPSASSGLSAPSVPGGLGTAPAGPSPGSLALAPPTIGTPSGVGGATATGSVPSTAPAPGSAPGSAPGGVPGSAAAGAGEQRSLLLDDGLASAAAEAAVGRVETGTGIGGIDSIPTDTVTMTEAEAREALAALEAARAAESAAEDSAASESAPAAALSDAETLANLPTDPEDIGEMSPEEALRALEALGVGSAEPVTLDGDDAGAGSGAEQATPEPSAPAESETAVAALDPAAVDEAPVAPVPPAAAAVPDAEPEPEAEPAETVPLGGVIEPGVEVENAATGIVPVPAAKPDPEAERQAALAPAASTTVSDAGDGAVAPEAPAPAAGDGVGGGERLALAGPALEVNARDFSLASGAQAISLVLLSPLDGTQVPVDALEGLGFPITIGLPATSRDARSVGERLRAAGHELIAELPANSEAGAIEDALASMPLGVAAAFMDGAGSGGRPRDDMLAVLAQNGFAYFDSRSIGGGAALRAARAAGVPAVSPDRGATSSVTEGQLLQTLNIAALVAKRQGTAVVVAPATTATLRAVLTFALEGAGG